MKPRFPRWCWALPILTAALVPSRAGAQPCVEVACP